MKKISSGIYKHYRGALYFVLDSANSGMNPTKDELCFVVYYPLYPAENIGWRFRPMHGEDGFFERIERPEHKYSGQRFVKIRDWKWPNILPGTVFAAPRSEWKSVIEEVLQHEGDDAILVKTGLVGLKGGGVYYLDELRDSLSRVL